jgi:hypothetical protein
MLDAREARDVHRAAISLAVWKRLERDRAVVLHPVELPDVPQVRIAHRRVARLVVGRDEVVAEGRIADAPQRIRSPEPFAQRIELPQRIVLAGFEHRPDRRAQRGAQPRFAVGITLAQDLLREAVELPGTRGGIDQRREQDRREVAAGHVRERMHGLPAVDAQRAGFSIPRHVQLARVAGGAGDVEHVFADAGVVVLREADRQLVRTGFRRRRIDEKAVLAHVIGVREALLRQRQLQMHEPVIADRAGGGALRHGRPLRSEVVPLAQRRVGHGAPALVQPHVFVDRLERRNGVDRPQHEPRKQSRRREHQHHGQRRDPLQRSTHHVSPYAFCFILQTKLSGRK